MRVFWPQGRSPRRAAGLALAVVFVLGADGLRFVGRAVAGRAVAGFAPGALKAASCGFEALKPEGLPADFVEDRRGFCAAVLAARAASAVAAAKTRAALGGRVGFAWREGFVELTGFSGKKPSRLAALWPVPPSKLWATRRATGCSLSRRSACRSKRCVSALEEKRSPVAAARGVAGRAEDEPPAVGRDVVEPVAAERTARERGAAEESERDSVGRDAVERELAEREAKGRAEDERSRP